MGRRVWTYPAHDFWTLPGCRLDGNESVFDCAMRELAEETSLAVSLGRIVYIQEFVEPGYHFCKFFILSSGYTGGPTIANKPVGEDHLVGVSFLSKPEIQELKVYPEILYDQFWNDLTHGFPQSKYLGLQHVDS